VDVPGSAGGRQLWVRGRRVLRSALQAVRCDRASPAPPRRERRGPRLPCLHTHTRVCHRADARARLERSCDRSSPNVRMFQCTECSVMLSNHEHPCDLRPQTPPTVCAQLLGLGLADAEHVLLTGDSAGGLAVFHATDAVADFLSESAPSLQHFKAVAVSGFFLDHRDVSGGRQYADAIRSAFAFHHAGAQGSGVSPGCLAAAAADGGDPSSCFFAQNAWPWVRKASLFAVNSAMDFFQTLCIVAGRVRSSGCDGIAGWHACRYDLNNCSASQMAVMVGFERDYVAAFRASLGTARRSQLGSQHSGFLYSCHNHCAADSVLFDRISVGGVVVRDAVTQFWDQVCCQSCAQMLAALPSLCMDLSRHLFIWHSGIQVPGSPPLEVHDPCLWQVMGLRSRSTGALGAPSRRQCNPSCYKAGARQLATDRGPQSTKGHATLYFDGGSG
jgi:hypothetical protein